MKKNLLFLLLVLFPLLVSAVESKSGYVGDWIDLKIEYSSSNLLGDATWRITKGPYNCVDFPTRTGAKVSLNIISYFTETLVVEARYQLKNGQNKVEYFNVTCNPVTLNVTPSRINLAIGEKDYIQYTTSPYGKHPQVDYESTNKSVVTVNYAGEVLGKGEGSATIKVTNSMGPEVEIPVTVGGGGDNPGGGGDTPGGGGGGGDTPGGGGQVGPDGNLYVKTSEGITMTFRIESGYAKVIENCISSANGTVTIPGWVSDGYLDYSVNAIFNAAFRNLSGLTELIIPNTVNWVQNDFVLGCKNLTTIVCNSLTPPKISNNNSLVDYSEARITLYVPKGSKSKYMEANGWKRFPTIKEIGVEEIEIAIDATNFPNEDFRSFLLRQDYGADGLLSEYEISKITIINCVAEGIGSLKGIEYFTSLEELYCDWNSVKSLDLSKNTKLRRLSCAKCGLTTLDLSQNTALVFLDCSLNRIEGAGMDNLINSLPKTIKGVFHVTRGSDNTITKTQVAAAKAKGWTPYYYDGNNNGKEIWLEYEGIEQNIIIDATNFPDDNFRKYLSEQDYGKDGIITEEELKTIRYISVSSYPGGIVSLQGIEFFSALEYLFCTYNQLTSLDLSKNTALTWLDCYENQLTSLDVSKCAALTWLSCQTNQLASLDISNNTALTNLKCDWNQLTSLDVSRNTALTYLGCSDNQLTSLDVSKNTALTNLYCPFNQLTSLDVSRNTALTSLHCERNELTKLDVSNNTDLKTLYVDRNQIWGDRMDALITSLPQARYNDNVFNVVYNPESDANVCTTIQVEAAMAKGWNPTYWNGTPYSGSDPSAIRSILMDGSYNTPAYNLNGQRLDKPHKGINIIGGKKVIVK